MKRFTASIRKSVNSGDWYGALSTALTLPDVCGRLEDPNQASKARYVAWFKLWMQPHYTLRVGADRREHIFLHGEHKLVILIGHKFIYAEEYCQHTYKHKQQYDEIGIHTLLEILRHGGRLMFNHIAVKIA